MPDAIDRALDDIDGRAFARRRVLDGPAPDRTSVSATEDRLRADRIGLTMWTLHNRCRPGHTHEAHRWMAGQVVDALFPRGAI